MYFKKVSWLLVILCLLGIFIMSNLNGVKSWYLTGEVLNVAKGNINSEATFEDKMASYEEDHTRIQMIVLRKAAHFTEYFILAFLLMNALLFSFDVKGALTRAVLFGVMYSFFDEFHQLFIPGRTPKIFDVGIDSLGVLVGCGLFYVLTKNRKVKTYGQ